MSAKNLGSIGKKPQDAWQEQQAKNQSAKLASGRSAHPTTDSAGFSWQGRQFQDQPYFAEGFYTKANIFDKAVASVNEGESDLEHLFNIFVDTEFLIPLITEGGDFALTPEGKVVDKTQELSVVTVSTPDNRNALCAFTSESRMALWNSEARAVPVSARRLALAAASENADRIVINPGSDDYVVFRRPAVWAVAKGQSWVQPWGSLEIKAEFDSYISQDSRITGFDLLPGDATAKLIKPELKVVMRIEQGLSKDELDELISKQQQLWVQSLLLTDSIDSMYLEIKS